MIAVPIAKRSARKVNGSAYGNPYFAATNPLAQKNRNSEARETNQIWFASGDEDDCIIDSMKLGPV
jgi:hypothetical protein